MRTKINKSKKGFTLIELMLAVAFLGTLLLSVAMLAMRLVNMYTKGATMRAVNSVGSAIVDDVRSHVTSSNLWSVSFEEGPTKEDQDKSTRRYYRVHTYDVKDVATGTTTQFVDYGAFCTNSYTYIFNYQAAMLRYRNPESVPETVPETQRYLMVGTDEATRPYALVRIKDTGCAQFNLLGMSEQEIKDYNDKITDDTQKLENTNDFMKAQGHYFKVNNEDDITVLLDGSTSDEGTDLQLYDFAVMSAAQSHVTNQVIYDIAFVLGTTRGGIDVKSSNNYCSKNSKVSGDTDAAKDYADHGISYCSVNRFDFVVRQTGGRE